MSGLWDWSYVREIMPALLHGLWITIELTVLGSALAFALGLVWSALRAVPVRGVRLAVSLIVEFLRGTPLIIQIFVLFYVLPKYGILLSAFLTGVLVLGVHFSAYTAEVYRAGIDSIARGQWEAAHALSMSKPRTWLVIVLPQALRKSVPALATWMVAMYKETALLFAIGVPVLLFEARVTGNRTFSFLEPFTIAGLLYLAVSYPSVLALRRLERRLA